jgi:hypothetical protein
MNPTEMPDVPLPPRRARTHFTFEPMPDDHGPAELLETLLKHPGRIIHELHADRRRLLAAWFLLFALCGMAIYGVVVGSLSGGAQLWIAPVKLALGTLLAVLICLPSLYIFSCLAGNEFRLRAVAGVLAAAVCLSSLLLIGFAPVAWIFSQSTDSLPFLGTLHLLFWLIGLSFGLRLLGGMNRFRGENGGGRLKSWSLVFILVCLQMTTTLRPIIGHSDHFLPREKKFFLTHWLDSLGGKP